MLPLPLHVNRRIEEAGSKTIFAVAAYKDFNDSPIKEGVLSALLFKTKFNSLMPITTEGKDMTRQISPRNEVQFPAVLTIDTKRTFIYHIILIWYEKMMSLKSI